MRGKPSPDGASGIPQCMLEQSLNAGKEDRLDVAIMIEGQDGLTWQRWQNLARAVEDLGFAGLYRSDHFTNPNPPDLDSLELWTSLTWLASHTSRIEFGPMVTPFSFRDPVFTARVGKDVNELSGSRLILGLGAGWQVREHEMFNYALDLSTGARFDRMDEGVEVVYRLLRDPERTTFAGNYYTVRDGILLPRPSHAGQPRILLGGTGEKRTLPLVAKFADEWNCVFTGPDRFAELNQKLDAMLVERGRPVTSVRRSLMNGIVFGRDRAEVQRKLDAGMYGGEGERPGIVVGTGEDVRAYMATCAAAGVERLLLQWLDQEDTAGLEALAKAVL